MAEVASVSRRSVPNRAASTEAPLTTSSRRCPSILAIHAPIFVPSSKSHATEAEVAYTEGNMRYKSRLFQALILVILGVSGVLLRAATPTSNSSPESQLASDSCSIQCPADVKAFPGMGSSVTCRAGHSPVCQCHDTGQKMAFCVDVSRDD